ncbi:MAG: hypothetical protein COA78_06715 [Blastopirellula sp.]|nr:MAG: hypothetical protein COA78_06715 [Blastopirellula sp.]
MDEFWFTPIDPEIAVAVSRLTAVVTTMQKSEKWPISRLKRDDLATQNLSTGQIRRSRGVFWGN